MKNWHATISILFLMFHANPLWSAEQIIFWDKQVNAGASASVIFPAQLATTLTINRPVVGATYTLTSKNCPSISQRKKATSETPIIFILKYPRVQEPDQLSLFSSRSIKDKSTLIASFKVFPITVLIKSTRMNFDRSAGYIVSGRKELGADLDDIKYQIFPWTNELKGKIELRVFKPLLGTPKIELSKGVADIQSDVITLKLTNGEAGITVITALLECVNKRKSTEKTLFECGTRLCVVVDSENPKYKNSTTIGEDKELESYLKKWWHIIDFHPGKQREASLKKFIIALRKCPKVPFYREAFMDFMNNPLLYRTIYNYIIKKEEQDSFPSLLAQFAMAHIPIDKAF